MSRAAEANPTVDIHPTALVSAGASLGDGVTVGPWAIVGENVTIGAGTVVGPRVLVEKNTRVGADCRLHNGAVLGTDPQDLKYDGEDTWLEVGDRTTVREFATLNRGTKERGRTVVGTDCLIMAYAHVAHDCLLGNHVILANSVGMAGHVTIQDWVTVGGLTAIHQFVRIGAHAFVGGGSRVSQDILPYCRAAGNPPKLYGLNTIGLERRGFSRDVRRDLKLAYRILFHAGLNVGQAVERIRGESGLIPEVRHFLEFIESSDRGIVFG